MRFTAAALLLVAAAATSQAFGRSESSEANARRRDREVASELRSRASAYDPVRAGEPPPAGFRQVLPRDAIRPIYAPQFRAAADTDWRDDTLVIGVERNGEAKAYPVSFLNHREIVNDELADWPILVTW